jgi:hypothetical protein
MRTVRADQCDPVCRCDHIAATPTRTLTAGLVISLVVALTACGGSSPTTSSPGEAGTQAATPTAQVTHTVDLVALDERGTGPTQLPKIEITAPDDWSNGGWNISKGSGAVAIMFWDVNKVYPTPCDWMGKPMVDPGSGVDGLASALANQPLRNATVPMDVELGGFSGKYLEWSVPADIDFLDCGESYFESWTGSGWASDRYQQAPGQVDRLWILDVDGERLVVDATYLPSATAHDRAELAEVVESIRFRE